MSKREVLRGLQSAKSALQDEADRIVNKRRPKGDRKATTITYHFEIWILIMTLVCRRIEARNTVQMRWWLDFDYSGARRGEKATQVPVRAAANADLIRA